MPAAAGCPDYHSSYCTVTFSDPTRDRITINPTGTGDTFAGTGITIRVFLTTASGAPMVGIPAQEIELYHPDLCLCPGGNFADAPTDQNGMTTFSGTIRGGGCAESLRVWATCNFIGTIPVKVNSQDALPASPCFVDASDLAALTQHLGVPAQYSICSDWNEDGVVDAGDVASFASVLGAACLFP